MFNIILSPLFIQAHMEQGKGPSLKIRAMDRKVDEAFMSIQNFQSSMDFVFSMQKALFERFGVHFPLGQEARMCESL
jgi:hypothetical protein